MISSRRWRLASFVVLLLAVALVVGLVIRGVVRSRPGPAPEQDPQATFDAFRLSGVDYTSFDAGVKVFSLEAGEIAHKKRKVGPLTMNPIKEIEMTEVRIEVHRHGEGEFLDIPFQQMLNELALDKNLGFVSRVIINGLDLGFVQNGERSFSLVCGTVTLNADATTALFEQRLSATSRWGDELLARTAEWRNDSREFWVEDRYVFRGDEGPVTGTGGRFAIDSRGRIVKKN